MMDLRDLFRIKESRSTVEEKLLREHLFNPSFC